MSTYKTSAADRRIAESLQVDQSLMCGANGCPNRWSVDGPQGRLCSAHAWDKPNAWLRITAEQQQAAYARQVAPKPAEAPARALTTQERREALQKLANLGTRRTGTGWAKRLFLREEKGFRMTPAQREMAVRALGGDPCKPT